MRIKPEMMGATTHLKTIGKIKVSNRHLQALAREGRFDIVEGLRPARKLEPLKKTAKKNDVKSRKKSGK